MIAFPSKEIPPARVAAKIPAVLNQPTRAPIAPPFHTAPDTLAPSAAPMPAPMSGTRGPDYFHTPMLPLAVTSTGASRSSPIPAIMGLTTNGAG